MLIRARALQRSMLIIILTLLYGRPVLAFPAFFSDDQQLSLPASGDIKYRRIRALGLHDGAPPNILDKPIIFPHLNSAGLASPTSNRAYLKQLVTNYPDIRQLSIRQKTPLDDESVLLLASFVKLNDFGLECPVAMPGALSRSLPLSLKTMYLGENCTLTDQLTTQLVLPNVFSFDIRACALSIAFASRCDAPKLHKIRLVNVRLQDGALKSLSSFPKLKTIEIEYGAKFTDRKSSSFEDEIDYLRKHGIRVKVIAGS